MQHLLLKGVNSAEQLSVLEMETELSLPNLLWTYICDNSLKGVGGIQLRKNKKIKQKNEGKVNKISTVPPRSQAKSGYVPTQQQQQIVLFRGNRLKTRITDKKGIL